MFHLIWRQRRRLLFTGFFATLAVVTWFSRQSEFVEFVDQTGSPADAFALLAATGPIIGVVCMALTAVVTVLLHDLRYWGEFFALGSFILLLENRCWKTGSCRISCGTGCGPQPGSWPLSVCCRC